MNLELWQFFTGLGLIIASAVASVYTIKGDLKSLQSRVRELEKYKEVNEPLKLQMNATMQAILSTLQAIEKRFDVMDVKFETYRESTEKEIRELIRSNK